MMEILCRAGSYAKLLLLRSVKKAEIIFHSKVVDRPGGQKGRRDGKQRLRPDALSARQEAVDAEKKVDRMTARSYVLSRYVMSMACKLNEAFAQLK